MSLIINDLMLFLIPVNQIMGTLRSSSWEEKGGGLQDDGTFTPMPELARLSQFDGDFGNFRASLARKSIGCNVDGVSGILLFRCFCVAQAGRRMARTIATSA